MSERLKRLREQRATVYRQLRGIVDPAADQNRKLTADEDHRHGELTAQLDSIDEAIGGIVEGERRTREAGDAFDRLVSLPVGPTGTTRQAPSLLPTAETLSGLHAAVTSRSSVRLEAAADVEERAAVLSTDTGASALATELVKAVREPRRIVRAANIPSQSVSGIESVKFPVFGVADEAGIVAEGATKPEYDDISPGSVTPLMISLWTDVSRQSLLSMPELDRRLRAKLAARVAAREDKLLYETVVGTTGIQTLVGELTPDLVLEGAAMIAASDVAMEPNLALVNPADVPTLAGTNVGTGGSASPGFSEFLPDLHGLAIYPTNAVAASEVVIGAWQTSTFVVGLPPTYLVDAVSQLKSNLVTTLLEEAVNLAIDEPAAFLRITAD